MKKIYQLLLCVSILCSTKQFATVLLSGQSDAAQGETFTVSVNKLQKANMSGAIYTSKGADGAGSFSIDRIFEGQTAFAPVISEKAFLGGSEVENPLFNKAIQAFDLFELDVNLFQKKEALLVTTAAEPQFIYFVEPVNARNTSIIADLERTDSLRDASGTVDAQVQTFASDRVGAVFAAVAPAGGIFGDPNSGIAVAARELINVQNGDEVTQKIAFNQIIADAMRLDGTEGITNITSNATIATPVDIYWDERLKRLFIALQVTSGAGGKARALVVGRVDDNRIFYLMPCLPDAAVAGNNQVIATGTENSPVTLHTVRTMHTSTGLSYAIVVGGNDVAANTQSSVFALPLVSSGDIAGTLATKFDSTDQATEPVTTFFQTSPKRFKSRDFTQAATTANQVTQNDEVAAQVGRGALPAGTITHLMVLNDTVFATVGDAGELPGVYTSRALFAANGVIKGWTAWQRATGTTDQIFNITYDRSDGSTLLFSGTDNMSVKTAKKTTWTNDTKITNAIETLLSSEDGNSQQLLSFAQQPGIDTISLLAVADTNTIALINTGEVNGNGLLMPTTNDAISIFENGAITSNLNGVFAVGISGTVLTNIGPITAVTIARNTNTNQTFIFVGGINGIAVLADGNGAGVMGSIQAGFTGITNGMSMHMFGDFSQVRKLFADNNMLYVLTDEQFIRINLNENAAITNVFIPTVLATRENLLINQTYGSFLDVIASDKLAFLATTKGLFVNGPTTDIQTATNSVEAAWECIALPENAGVPIALTTATPTNNDRDIAREETEAEMPTPLEGGNLWALSADRGNNISRTHRIALDYVTIEGQQNPELRPVLFDDILLESMPTFFLNFGQYKNIFFSDGARYFIGQNKNIVGQAELALLNQKYPLQVGVANIGNQSIIINALLQGATEISACTQDRAAGSYVLSGDHGVSIHE